MFLQRFLGALRAPFESVILNKLWRESPVDKKPNETYTEVSSSDSITIYSTSGYSYLHALSTLDQCLFNLVFKS